MNDKAFILSPIEWPLPLLPVKRGNLINGQLGVIKPTELTTVYLKNLLEVDDIEAADKIVYNSVDQLLADGWMVD